MVADETNASIFEDVFELIPERRIASLYDVAVLYAACDLYEKLTSDLVEGDISPEALQSMTPLKKADLLDPEKDNSFIAVQIDLSETKPKLGDPPVVIENYTKEVMYHVGYMARAKKSGKKTDYSITNHANGKPVDEIAYDDDYGSSSTVANRFLRGRLERWPFSDTADRIITDGDDKDGVIESLRILGDDEERMATVEQRFLDEATFDETEAMVGVKVKLNADGEYLYPGQVPALNKVALRNQYDHLRDGLSVSNAFGEGIGFISGETGTVLGGSAGILGQYGKKQVGRFPDLNSSECWRTRPLREQQAIAVSNFGSIVDQFYSKINSVRMYYLPYPRDSMTLDLFKQFHDEVYIPLLSADDSLSALERVLSGARTLKIDENNEDDNTSQLAAVLAELDEANDRDEASAYEVFEGHDAWLHVYGLLHDAGSDPPRSFVDEPSISLRALAELSDESDRVVETLGGSSLFGTMVAKMDHLSRGQTPRRVLQGQFFDQTTAKTPDEKENRMSNFAATADDPLFSRDAKLLRGEPITLKPLLADYVDRIIKEERRDTSTSTENADYWQWNPVWTILKQYVQLLALEHAKLLTPDIVLSHDRANVSQMELNRDYESRDSRLQGFLDTHAMLDAEEARAVFLTGGLIARVTATQHQKDISTKMVDQHPVSSVNKRSLLRVAHQAIEKNETYEQMDDRGQLNRRYTDRLPGAMLTTNPTDWDLTETEVKWLYSLGIAYGKQDSSLADETRENAPEEEPQATVN
jgi:hypothetical protein